MGTHIYVRTAWGIILVGPMYFVLSGIRYLGTTLMYFVLMYTQGAGDKVYYVCVLTC